MLVSSTGAAQVLARFGDQLISCSPYVLARLGVEKGHCFLKIEDYTILCVPFQFGFKRSLFIASLSKQEMAFFSKYLTGNVGLSIGFVPKNRKSEEPVKFFIRCVLSAISPFKGRDNVGIFELDYKTTPDDLVSMLGEFLEFQGRIKGLYEEYGTTPVKMTVDAAKMMGYNMFASISEPNGEPRRIQVYLLSSKNLEHLEAAGGRIKAPGSPVTYQLFFRKYRVTIPGVVHSCIQLPNGLIRTVSSLPYSPDLVDILDDYWTEIKK